MIAHKQLHFLVTIVRDETAQMIQAFGWSPSNRGEVERQSFPALRLVCAFPVDESLLLYYRSHANRSLISHSDVKQSY